MTEIDHEKANVLAHKILEHPPYVIENSIRLFGDASLADTSYGNLARAYLEALKEIALSPDPHSKLPEGWAWGTRCDASHGPDYMVLITQDEQTEHLSGFGIQILEYGQAAGAPLEVVEAVCTKLREQIRAKVEAKS